jgi:hypothetical protein
VKSRLLLIASLIAVAAVSSIHTPAQTKPSDELPKYEVAVDFTTLTLNESQTYAGVGGRFTFNLNRHIALEAAGYFSPGKCDGCNGEITGHITEGLFGVKVGQRFRRFGIFGKARPGIISFSQGFFDLVPNGGSGPFPFNVVVKRQTNFAADLGGVLEIYPTKHLVLRFDAGTTVNRMESRPAHSIYFDQATGVFTPFTFTRPGFTTSTFQFIGGVGFRF